MNENIVINGARENNLKNVSVEIPRNKLVVITGVSGSGKSSLAFDTLYAEGQMRYVESLSAYARQFLGQKGKPDVDSIDGLSPAIAINQKTTSNNPRSTVGTVTEVYDYLRLLWANVGIPHCPNCGREISKQSVDQIVENVLKMPEGTRFQLLAPVIRGKKGEHKKVFESAAKSGFARVRVDGIMYDLSEDFSIEKTKKHDIEIVVDRLIVRDNIERRLVDSVETATKLSNGIVIIQKVDDNTEEIYSQNYACDECGISMTELTPRMFSFNNPTGACKNCSGLGFQMTVEEDVIIPDRNKSLMEGGIAAPYWDDPKKSPITKMFYQALSDHYHFDLNTPIKDLSPEILDVILHGSGDEQMELTFARGRNKRKYMQRFEGVIPNMERRYRTSDIEKEKQRIEAIMASNPCPACHGDRLDNTILAVTVGSLNISDFCKLSVDEELDFIRNLNLKGSDVHVAEPILREINARLTFMKSLGLGYLTLHRAAGTLSGGESQRIRLSTQIGSGLMGVLYILDEPSIGLHQRDNDKLIASLKKLRDLGNTVIVVEHDEETMREADWIIDVGPGAGVHGGEIVATGKVEDVEKSDRSLTGKYLSGKIKISVPKERRGGNGHFLQVVGAQENNLKNITVNIPLGTFTCVTGISGSGKSSLVNEIIYKRLANDLNRARLRPGKHKDIKGLEHLDKIINIDQSPIGRTPRSNPATYTGVFTDIRALFAQTTSAKSRAFGPGRFSFNVRGGRCEACQGNGLVRIEMNFLPDVYVPCDVCDGRQYNRETLEVKYKEKNIAEVLDMTVDESLDFFDNIPKIKRKITALSKVGLGYIKLGQSSTTLSGGEAQRIKLATELAKRSTGSTFYVLDEPTTGLHIADVHQLLKVLHALVEEGNTVLVIEHNLDVIKCADYIIDLGPEGGNGGGDIVCTGTPEEVANCPESYTGKYLKPLL